jgi:methionyl-tRNA formyltransferase
MNSQSLRIVFLVGSDNDSTRRSIESVCLLPDVRPVAVLLDTAPVSLKRRLRNLHRNIRKQGVGYLFGRILAGMRRFSDRLVESAVVSPDAVARVLRAAFPSRCFSLAELGAKYGFEDILTGSLNSPEAVRALASCEADLGVVIGTRILTRNMFSVPRMGCINLHKGRVPEYRGMPPAFWELHDGAASAGVTVHFVDDGLDTGDVIARSDIPIAPKDTPETLREKLHQEGARLLAAAVQSIQLGTASREMQVSREGKPRTKPTVCEIRELRARLPHWRQPGDAAVLVKNLYALLLYHSGLFRLLRVRHSRTQRRACVLLYHRVNDFSKDVLTVDTRTFAAQLMAIQKWYTPMGTTELGDRLRRRENIRPTAVAIHFDDCYRDVVTDGRPILKALNFPATAFISSGFIDTDRSFAHDQRKYPFRYENMRADDVRDWICDGFEVGAHTVNHVDLGQCSMTDARLEILASRAQLEAVIRGTAAVAERGELGGNSAGTAPVRYFSFPFGGIKNIRPEVVRLVRDAGYDALFSAHGGFIDSTTELYDIPRIGASGEHRPLYLLLEVEGLMPNQLAGGLKRLLRR